MGQGLYLKSVKELTVLKNKFPEYSAAKIPTLEEVLDAVKASGMQVNIELKTGIYWYPEIEQKVADLLKKDRKWKSGWRDISPLTITASSK